MCVRALCYRGFGKEIWQLNVFSVLLYSVTITALALFTHRKLQRISSWNWVWHNLLILKTFKFCPWLYNRFYLGFLSLLGSILAVHISQGEKKIIIYNRFSNFAWSFKRSLFCFIHIVFICICFPRLISKFAYLCFLPFSLININLPLIFLIKTCHRLVLFNRPRFLPQPHTLNA